MQILRKYIERERETINVELIRLITGWFVLARVGQRLEDVVVVVLLVVILKINN